MQILNYLLARVFFLTGATAVLVCLPVSAKTLQQTEVRDGIGLAQNTQGTVEGRIAYPSDFTPAMRVCGQSTQNPYLMSCVSTEENQPAFSLTLDPGDYYFFAFEANAFPDGRGYFLFHTVGGFQAGGSNVPASVSVVAGQTTTGVTANNPRTCTEYSQYCATPPR